MATARDLVDAAMRKIGVVAEDEALTADQAAHGVAVLNRMIAGWELQGVTVGWRETESAEEVDLPLNIHEAVIFCLAERLGPDYMRPAPDATRHFRAIQAAYLIIPDVRVDRILRKTPSQRRWGGWWIE
jgi:hypothetical protein